MKILFLAPYPAYESPSQRYRFEHYLPFLQERGIRYDYRPFLSRSAWSIFFTRGHQLRKIWGVASGFLRRWWLMTGIGKYDYVFIHREAAPLGPPVFEWIVTKLFRKKIIYDFDDAIWIPVSSQYNKGARYVKWFSKVGTICKWAHKVSAGNDYLASFARKYNRNVFIVPTVVDTQQVHNRMKDQATGHPDIGWTGTFSTLKYLDMLLPALQYLQERFDFTFIVIADRDPALPLKRYRFVKWKKETEAEDLLKMNIGLMPLYDDEISKGKCGFKAIQYMSLGLPAAVSPVGVNSVIVDEGVNGFICATIDEWKEKLTLLLTDENLRKSMGNEARRKIEDHYSVQSSLGHFVKLFSDQE